MSTPSLDIILQQIRKKEEEEAANMKRIKECESIIRAEENNIKELTAIKKKIADELEAKVIKNCTLEIDKEIFEQQNQIWTNLLSENRNVLKEEENNLEALQQSVFQNRASFCDDMWHYLNNHDWLKMAKGLKQTSPTTSAASIVVKTERDDEEYKNLADTLKCLEMESNELDIKLAHIEEAKQQKARLLCEPSSGDEFLRLQKSIQDVNIGIKGLDEQIESIKKEIAHKDNLIMNKSKLQGSNILKQNEPKNKDNNSTSALLDICSSTSTLKVVKFNDTVQTKNISPSPPESDAKEPKAIVQKITTKYTPQLPSNKLLPKKRSHQELDEEMIDILFKKQ